MPTRPLESEWAGPAEAPPPGSFQSRRAPQGLKSYSPGKPATQGLRTTPLLLGGKTGPTWQPHGPQSSRAPPVAWWAAWSEALGKLLYGRQQAGAHHLPPPGVEPHPCGPLSPGLVAELGGGAPSRSPADQACPLRGAAGAHRTQTVRTRGRARGAVKLPCGDPERSRQTLHTDPWDLPVPPQGPNSLQGRSSPSMPGSLFWGLVSA